MTGVSLGRSKSVDRREFLAGTVSVSTTLMAGCGDSQSANRHPETAADENQVSSNSEDNLPKRLQQTKREIETVFTQLSNLPIFEKDEFVFDVNYFENEFDHQGLKKTAERAIEQLEQTNTNEVPDLLIERLITSAKIGRQLVAQRVMTHQIIAAGLNLERKISHGHYVKGLDVIQTAKQLLENLRKTGERIEVLSPKDLNSDFSINGYDPTAIEISQENLVDVVRWSDHVYEAFRHSVNGLKKYSEGNTALESARYKMAKSSYEESERRFQAAAMSFNGAQGTGRKIPHLVHLVEGLRCLIPAYLTSSGPLQSSMEEFNAGNEKRAREIAREAISSANEKATRCL